MAHGHEQREVRQEQSKAALSDLTLEDDGPLEHEHGAGREPVARVRVPEPEENQLLAGLARALLAGGEDRYPAGLVGQHVEDRLHRQDDAVLHVLLAEGRLVLAPAVHEVLHRGVPGHGLRGEDLSGLAVDALAGDEAVQHPPVVLGDRGVRGPPALPQGGEELRLGRLPRRLLAVGLLGLVGLGLGHGVVREDVRALEVERHLAVVDLHLALVAAHGHDDLPRLLPHPDLLVRRAEGALRVTLVDGAEVGDGDGPIPDVGKHPDAVLPLVLVRLHG